MSIKFSAIELKPNESAHDGITVFFKYASGLGLQFSFLEPYGTLTIGSVKLLRFKTDCPDLSSLLSFFQEENRSFAFPDNTGYALHTQTTKGVVPITAMQASKLPGFQRKYRGTSNKFWERQFT